jgi:hypothetical protein
MGKLSDEHYTPKWIFDKLDVVFDLDVSAPEGGVPWIPAKNHYTEAQNGLEMPWFGNVWMNPPYSKVTPWVDKFLENKNGICLLVVSRSKWFKKLWLAADGILPSPPDLKFERPDGIKPVGISYQTFMFALGKNNVEALKRLEGKVR